MSRRKDSQALVESLAKVINSGSGYARPMTAKQARDLKQEQARLLEEKRANSMRHLLRRQFGPCYVALGVLAVGAICWLVRWLVDPLFAVTVAGLVVLVLALVAFMVGRRTDRWAGRVHFAAVVASSWLLWTAMVGPSWWAPSSLVLGTIVSSARWWQVYRIPIPKAPNRGPVPVSVDQSIPVLWAEHLGADGAILAGSRLTDRDTSKANCESYTVNLRPGKQAITAAISQLELIAGGLLTPVKQVILEPHPNQNPNHVKLTVVQHSPIDQTLTYAGARLSGEQRNIIDVGPYGDGDGYAPWRMWAPGEQPMTGSWLSGFIVGGTGIGKSRLMELLAAGYMASGNAIVWFADPQGGASSPALKEYADWYVDADGTPLMLAVLEEIAQAREMENSVEGWTRFDPSPERPGIVVFLDECQVTFGVHGKRWANLARKTQKVGISFVGLTQYASLESLGGQEPLRASLLANAIVMKANSKENKNLITGLEVNPETLPKIPGFGYVIGTDGTRTAPFRAEYLADPARWFGQYRMPTLDALSANAAGDAYQGRREAQAELHEANWQKVEAMRSGTYQPESDEPDLDDEGTPEPRAFQVVRFPSAVAPPERPARERVLAAVARGVTRTALIADEVALGKSRLAEVLKELVADGALQQPTRGVYRIAGSEGNVED